MRGISGYLVTGHSRVCSVASCACVTVVVVSHADTFGSLHYYLIHLINLYLTVSLFLSYHDEDKSFTQTERRAKPISSADSVCEGDRKTTEARGTTNN